MGAPGTALRCEWATEDGVADGIRTHDNRNHNPGLYQLSYSHRCVDRYGVGPSITACAEPITANLRGRLRQIGTPDRTRTCYPRLRRPVLYPIELRALDCLFLSDRIKMTRRRPGRRALHWMVGVERFELPTSCSQSKRATRLRYTPRGAIMPSQRLPGKREEPKRVSRNL